MEKIRKILFSASGVIAILGAILYMFHNTDFNSVLLYFFLLEGLVLLAIEATTKSSRKPLMKIILILIPALVAAMAIQGIITDTYPFSSMLISVGMYFLISERFMLSPKKS